MTTVRTRPFYSERVLPLDFPSYAYHHPSIQTFTLGTSREGICHPFLSDFQRMEMDSLAGQLPDISNKPVKCTRDDFQRSKTSLDPPITERIQSLPGITQLQRDIFKLSNSADELRTTRLQWSKFLNKCPERYKIKLHELPENCCKDLEYSGYAVRYLRPQLSEAWKRPISRYIPTASPIYCTECCNRRSYLPF